MDPWGTPYRVMVNSNYDNLLLYPIGEFTPVGGAVNLTNVDVIAMSAGPDKVLGTSDDIMSYRIR